MDELGAEAGERGGSRRGALVRAVYVVVPMVFLEFFGPEKRMEGTLKPPSGAPQDMHVCEKRKLNTGALPSHSGSGSRVRASSARLAGSAQVSTQELTVEHF